MLAVAEGLQRDLGAELDRSGDVDQRVDLLRADSSERVVGDHGPSGANRVLEGRPARSPPRCSVEAGVLVDLGRALEAPAVDRRHAHARDAVDDRVGEPLGHESGADHAHPDRAPLALAGLEQVVDDDHRTGSPPPARASERPSSPGPRVRPRRAGASRRPSPRSRSPAAAS